MTFISKIPVGLLVRRPSATSDPGQMHRAVMGLFASVPEADGVPRREHLGVLWRLEPDGHVLVRSAIAPTNLPAQALMHEELRFDLPAKERVLFRASVNAIRRHSTRRGGGHEPVEEIEPWLADKLAPAFDEVVVFSHDRSVGISRERALTVQRDTVDGTARVSDPDAAQKVLATGVGRAKAFGCGLLTVVPVR